MKIISLFQRQLISRHKSINRDFQKRSASTGQVQALLLLSSIPERIAVWKHIGLPTAIIREKKHTHTRRTLRNCCVYKMSRKTINNKNCKKYMAPRNNGRQKLPNSQLSLVATSYAAAQNCGHTKTCKKTRWRKKKSAGFKSWRGRKQIKTHERIPKTEPTSK